MTFFFFFLIESKIDAKIGKVYLFALFVLRNESNVIASCSSLFFFFFFFFFYALPFRPKAHSIEILTVEMP